MRRTKKTLLAVCVLIGITLYIHFRSSARKPWYHYPSPCSYPKAMVEDSKEMAVKVDSLLTKENIAHVLCYGSLWGALRIEGMLPYDNDVDFCIWNDDLEHFDEGYFNLLFRQQGMTLSFDPLNGVYTVYYESAVADLVIFELSEDYTWMQRVGVLQKMEPEERREKFPSKLIAPPVPMKKFQGENLPVPRGGIEIQKYIYPNDWWRVVKPPNCVGPESNEVSP